jgi:hypothetical protein
MCDTPSGASTPRDLDDRLAAVESEVRDVRTGLDDLRRALDHEVRTRRLVVVDRGGFERLVADGGGDDASVTLRARGSGSGSTAVQLFANDPVDGDEARVGVALADGGEIVAVIEVSGDAGPTVWLRQGDAPDPPGPGEVP